MSNNNNNRYYYHPNYITGLGDGNSQITNSGGGRSSSLRAKNSHNDDDKARTDDGDKYDNFLRTVQKRQRDKKSLRYRATNVVDDLVAHDNNANNRMDDALMDLNDKPKASSTWAQFFGAEPDPFSSSQRPKNNNNKKANHQSFGSSVNRHSSHHHRSSAAATNMESSPYYTSQYYNNNNEQYDPAPWQLSAFALLGAVVLLSALFLHVLADTTAETQQQQYRRRRNKQKLSVVNHANHHHANNKNKANGNEASNTNPINNAPGEAATAATTKKEKTDDDVLENDNDVWAYNNKNHHHLGASSSYDDDDHGVLRGIAAGDAAPTGTETFPPPSLYHPYYQPRLRKVGGNNNNNNNTSSSYQNRAYHLNPTSTATTTPAIPGNASLYRSPKPTTPRNHHHHNPAVTLSPIPQPQFVASNNLNAAAAGSTSTGATTITSNNKPIKGAVPPKSRTTTTSNAMSPRVTHPPPNMNYNNNSTTTTAVAARKTLTPPHIYKPTKSQSSLLQSNSGSTSASTHNNNKPTTATFPPVPYMGAPALDSSSFAKKPAAGGGMANNNNSKATTTTTTTTSRTITPTRARPIVTQAPLSPLVSEDPSEQSSISSSNFMIAESLQAPSQGGGARTLSEDSTHRWTNIGKHGDILGDDDDDTNVFADDDEPFVRETPRINNGGRRIVQQQQSQSSLDMAFASPPVAPRFAPEMPFLPPLPDTTKGNSGGNKRNKNNAKNKPQPKATTPIADQKKFKSFQEHANTTAQQQQQQQQQGSSVMAGDRPHAINVDDLQLMESGNWHHHATSPSPPPPPPPPPQDDSSTDKSLPPRIPSHDQFPSLGIMDDNDISSQTSVKNDDRPVVDHVRHSLITDTDSAKSLQGAIDFSELELVEVIGGGGFGQVWRANWRSTPVAVKVLTGSAQSQKVPRAVLEEFAAEINLLRGMRHPNICLYMGACLQPPNRAIITELAANGSLWDALRLPLNPPYRPVGRGNGGMSETEAWPPSLFRPDPRHGLPPSRTTRLTSAAPNNKDGVTTPTIPAGTWSWALVKRVACGTARGMVYLHSGTPPVLHRDLKSANILLDESYNPKVCDFGLSRLQSAAGASMTGNCGTVQWMAPEVLANQRYNEKADVFSYGIILWELLTRACPYEGQNAVQCALAVLNRNHRPSIPQWCPPVLHALIRACLKTDPQERPDFTKILTALESMPTS